MKIACFPLAGLLLVADFSRGKYHRTLGLASISTA